MRDKIINKACINVAVALSELTRDEALYVLCIAERTQQRLKEDEGFETRGPQSKKVRRLYDKVKTLV